MASHRKPRPRGRILTGTVPRAAVGLTTAALASVTLLGETANAAPAKPTVAEVKARIDALNQQAEVATQRYDQAHEKAADQRSKVNQLLDEAARKTQAMNETRRLLGQFATAQYREGGLDQTTQLLLSDDPQQFLDRTHMLDRLSATQTEALRTFQAQQEQAAVQRAQATASLAELTAAQHRLAAEKHDVQTKLAAAQRLLNSLTAQQREALARLSRPSASSASYTYTGPATGRAAQAIRFALAQRGKPYVYGASGPGAYDCSGLTQAAYASAGIAIDRTTWAQYGAGTHVAKSDLRPGDLVFFYSGLSHVGIYLGNGQMVHAPHTGAVVEIAPISWMPFAGAVRLA